MDPTAAFDGDVLTGLEQIRDLISHHTTCVLTGAGISTDSGIPDYRGPGRETRARPMTYREFTGSETARRRYWARSSVGWPWMASRTPNQSHHAVAELQGQDVVTGIITQNVDGLHQKAGSQQVIELHGSLNATVCLECGESEPRESLQHRIQVANPGWAASSGRIAPDGDVELDESWIEGFIVPVCLGCGGVLKPDVVFFGENVPRHRVDQAFGMVHDASALLVLGSSLTVFSGFRFVDRAVKRGMRVLIINDGPTRGDPSATIKVDCRLQPALDWLAGSLS